MTAQLQPSLFVATVLLLSACASAPIAGEGDANTAFTYIKQRDFASAKSYLDRALADNPDNAKAHLNLGVVYQATGNPSGAREQYNLAIADDKSGQVVTKTATSDGSTGSIAELAKRNLKRME